MTDNASLAAVQGDLQLVMIDPEIEMEPDAALDMLKSILNELSTRPPNPEDIECLVTADGDEKMVHNELVEAAYHYMKAVHNSSHRALEKATEEYAEANVKVGKVLHEIFFDSTLDLTKIEGLHPYKAKARSWKSLMAKTDKFLKPSAVRNLLRCAAQDKWFEKEKIDRTGLKYTHLVLLSREENNDEKRELISTIKAKNWSARDLQDHLNKDDPPPTLDESLTAAAKWIKEHKKDKFLEDIVTTQELAPKLAVDRLKEVNELMKHLNFAMVRLRSYRKDLKEAAAETINPY